MKISRNPFEAYNSLNKGTKPAKLEWEESALDHYTSVEGFFDENRQVPAILWPKILLVAFFAIILGRIFYLQVIQGSSLRALSDNNRIRSQTILAPRGKVMDRNGQVLVQNAAGYNLVAIPADLPKEGLTEEVQKLAGLFGIEISVIADKIKNASRNSFQPVVLKQDISADQNILFETRSSEFVGFDVQKVPIRDYVDGPVFSHVVGYTGLISPQELTRVNRQQYDLNDFIGKAGIEAEYEKYLHGVNGQLQVEVDSTGRLSQVLGEVPPAAGDTLELNIDKDLQERLYQDLTKDLSNHRGAAVALNPKTGEVLALVSLPGFDNNLFAHGISSEDYSKLVNNQSSPLLNRAIAGTYPPGSTVKPMVATAALTEGVIDENTQITDRGNLVVPNQFNPSIVYNFHGWKPEGLGTLTVRSAIAMSSDIFFYTVAGGAPNTAVPDGLGAQRLADWYRKFNLGKISGIDLPGEQPGLVPDPAWKEQYFHNDPIAGKWYLGDTYHMGIGQGDLLVTPLQVALWTSVIANGGTAYVPRLANRVVDINGKTVWQSQAQVLISNIAPIQDIKIVQEGMRQTVLAGTARALQSLPISSAGKTGTSQFDGSDPSRTHAWFTAYAPYEDPQIVITVLVEAGGEGNAAAEPVVRDALSWWASNRYKK